MMQANRELRRFACGVRLDGPARAVRWAWRLAALVLVVAAAGIGGVLFASVAPR